MQLRVLPLGIPSRCCSFVKPLKVAFRAWDIISLLPGVSKGTSPHSGSAKHELQLLTFKFISVDYQQMICFPKIWIIDLLTQQTAQMHPTNKPRKLECISCQWTRQNGNLAERIWNRGACGCNSNRHSHQYTHANKPTDAHTQTHKNQRG